jgi:hypothetical protein
MFMIYLCTKFNMPSSSVIVIKPKVKKEKQILTAAKLFYFLQKDTLTKVAYV